MNTRTVNRGRRQLVLWSGSAAVSALGLGSLLRPGLAGAAAPFPYKSVRMIVGFAPGGATDFIGRELARELQQIWRQPVVIDNRAGAGGMLAGAETARSAPDGYTLFFSADGAITGAPLLQEKVPYNPLTDLTPIALVGGLPLILVAHPMLHVKNFSEFIAAAKARPGEINYASGGIGASHHLSMEMLQQKAGIKLNHIAYKGGAPAMQDVLGGQVPLMWVAVSTGLPFIESGQLVPLAIGSLKRSPLLPNVPTVDELGYPKFEAGNWVGLFGPKGMSPVLAAKIEADAKTVCGDKAYQERLASQANESRFDTGSEFGKRVETEYMRNKALFVQIGVTKD